MDDPQRSMHLKTLQYQIQNKKLFRKIFKLQSSYIFGVEIIKSLHVTFLLQFSISSCTLSTSPYLSQSVIACSNLTIETLKQNVKYA